MKFSDIPQMTQARYTVNVDLPDLVWKIEHFQSEYDLQIQPDFQRAHVWEDGRSAKFVEYVLRGGRSALDFFFNHPGWQGSYNGQMVLVDGQQRLTALLAFLRNELPVFGNLYRRDFEDRPSHVMLNFHVNNLKTRAEVLTWYLNLNEGGIAHTPAELDKVRQMLAQEQK